MFALEANGIRNQKAAPEGSRKPSTKGRLGLRVAGIDRPQGGDTKHKVTGFPNTIIQFRIIAMQTKKELFFKLLLKDEKILVFKCRGMLTSLRFSPTLT